jgi:hypothetical protein
VMICCGMAVRRVGLLGVGECEECADTAKAYRIYHALCKKHMKLTVKYFFLADILFLGGSS